jgi:ribosomal protein L11 methyltransferase
VNQRWYCLKLQAPAADAAEIADLLQGIEALSVSLIDAKDQPLFQLAPNEHPLWQQTKVLALFHEEHEAKIARDFIGRCYPNKMPAHEIEAIEEEDWVRLTQQQFPPQRFGNNNRGLWVVPSWESPPANDEPYIRIDPGLAFGTGTHPTTALCLSWLADHPPQNLNVIDYGCGSGILALGALALGAKHVIAIDHDEQAIEASQNNLALNKAIQAAQLATYISPVTPEPADLVLANILANPLIELADAIQACVKPGGQLLLSGLLSEECERVLKHYNDCKLVERAEQDGWARLTLQKQRSHA